MRSWGDETAHADFSVALRRNRHWLVESSNYWNEIRRFRKHFPDEQILVVFFEDFVEDWHGTLRRCFEFLEVDPDASIDESQRHLNRSKDKRIRRPAVSRLRALPGMETAFALARRALPEAVRAPIRNRVLNARVDARPAWSSESRRWVVDQLRGDTERFLAAYGKPSDFWDLAG
jgi:hypothetical protein